MAYYNPQYNYITVYYNPLYTLNNQVNFSLLTWILRDGTQVLLSPESAERAWPEQQDLE